MKPRQKHVLLVIETSRAYGRGIIEGVSRYVQERGHWLITFEEQGILTTVPDVVKTWRGDGIICRTGSSPLGEYIRSLQVPTVELLGDGVSSLSEVQSSAAATGQLAAEHFVHCGLTHFAYYTYGNTWWGEARGNAYENALRSQGYSCLRFESSTHTPKSSFPVWNEESKKDLVKWLRALPAPVGIWCAADTIAFHVHRACSELGLRIPDDVALLGADNDTHLCNVLTPQLSSVDPNSGRVGYQAASLLAQKMDRRKKMPELPLLVEPLGVATRQSTDIIAVDDPDMVRLERFLQTNACEKIGLIDIERELALSRRTAERRY
ncbi:MAG: XylR family transcriptional regulator [Planctomycetia bacterium]|nr:XylR family transcriptional regulator [Planctomycetia bacterium]